MVSNARKDYTDALWRERVENCCKVLHDVESSVPWDRVSDYDKTTKRLAVAALLEFLDTDPETR